MVPIVFYKTWHHLLVLLIPSVLQNGWTSLHFAAKAGHQSVVKYLVESGSSTRFPTSDGKVPICYAASFAHFDVLSYLMQKDHSTQNLMDDKKVSSS